MEDAVRKRNAMKGFAEKIGRRKSELGTIGICRDFRTRFSNVISHFF